MIITIFEFQPEHKNLNHVVEGHQHQFDVKFWKLRSHRHDNNAKQS